MGLVVVYKATTVVNFAHGELFMVGGFLAYTFHVLLKLGYVMSLVLAVGAALVLGLVTERLAYRPLMRAPAISLVLAAVGFSFVLKGTARQIWGGIGDYIPFPPLVATPAITLGSIILVPQQLVVLAGALICMGLFTVFFTSTRAGKMLQATAENAKAARLVGIRVDRVYAFTWAAGAATGAAAAVLMAPLTFVYPDVGSPLLVKAFAAAVLGGFGSPPRARPRGFPLRPLENLPRGHPPTSLTDISAFLVIMLVLIVRPTGFFGPRAVRDRKSTRLNSSH